VLDAFKAMPEHDRFVRGMVAWLGFRQTEITFHRSARAAGKTKYPVSKMVRLAVDGLIGFSDAPLRLAIWIGFAVSMLALCYGLYVIGLWMTRSDLVTGWSSTIVVISFLCGINMMLTGIIGIYIGRIHAEVKRRPLYVVDTSEGVDRAAARKAEPRPKGKRVRAR
jgi:polyisoprenyl-phosphate glycosyltransferase